MAKPWKAAVTNDWQIPFCDYDAIDVAKQIIRDFGPVDVLDFNGDIYDFLGLSKHPSAKTLINEPLAIELESEIERGVEIVQAFVEETKPKYIHWKNGNHEFRFLRAIANADQTAKKILELKVVREAYSYPSLFRFKELPVKVRFAGNYPHGLWVHSGLPKHENIWAEHGMVARKHSGYTANAILNERFCSAIVGHCERLAGPLWTHKVGMGDLFAIENGNLSILGVPGPGDDQRTGFPHSVPDYMNSCQGFTLLVHANGNWYPQTVRINRGEAWWSGQLYKSRIKKSGQTPHSKS
jgi:hypothetical protein